MSSATPLDRLAEAHHIEPGYTDIWGKRHEVGAESKRALLAAMGVAADSDDAIDASLAAARRRAFERFAPAVLVVAEGARIIVPIVAEADVAGRIIWAFTTEDGELTKGEAALADLDIMRMAWPQKERSLPLPLSPPPGYHRLTLILAEREGVETEIIITPKRAHWPACLDRSGGLSGLTAPLYGLRSGRNAGIGDFADLAAAPMGADFIGINPVHALFPAEPDRISPYSPSSRFFLNGLHIALDHVPELASSEEAQRLLENAEGVATLDRLRASEWVDYPAVSAFKHRVLEALFRAFCALSASSPRRQAFEAFRNAVGDALERHARFEALAEFFSTSDHGITDWRQWPAGYRIPESPAVQAFAEEHADRVSFYAYLQWLAADQLQGAKQRTVEGGMALGLYLDLAVGVAPDGAEAWSQQDALVDGVRIGAPPDDFNPDGQNWGLLPFSPAALKAQHYRPFIHLLRQNMRSAGALRIDHVLGLARSFWLPADGRAPGAYIRYPLKDLLGLAALESVRNQCLIVGEDLGTVPATLRAALEDHGLFGCRVLYFERDEEGAHRPASSYPSASIASIGTHDLPTLKGFWQGRDIAWRERLGLYGEDGAADSDRQDREQAKANLLHCLAHEGLLSDGIDPSRPPADLPAELVLAFHRFLGRTSALLKTVQLEDVVGAEEQPNLPGTIDEHPNWRRKIDTPIEQLARDERLSALLKAASEGDLAQRPNLSNDNR